MQLQWQEQVSPPDWAWIPQRGSQRAPPALWPPAQAAAKVANKFRFRKCRVWICGQL